MSTKKMMLPCADVSTMIINMWDSYHSLKQNGYLNSAEKVLEIILKYDNKLRKNGYWKDESND